MTACPASRQMFTLFKISGQIPFPPAQLATVRALRCILEQQRTARLAKNDRS